MKVRPFVQRPNASGSGPQPDLMSAVQFERFGDPEVLTVVTVPRPSPGPHEVLVRVGASTVNPFDAFVRSGTLKIVTGRRFPMGVGLDFAGTIVETGAEVVDLTVGSHVWGMVSPKGSHRTGSAAEYVVVPRNRVMPFPGQLSMLEAASLVTSGATAIRAVRDVAATRVGERVLVRGAAGGVGMIIVQLAHASGAHVSALAGQADADFVRSCGADKVFDYRTVGPSEIDRFDVIFDTTGRDLLAFRRRLSRHGRMVTINFGSAQAIASIGLSMVFGSRRIRSFSDYPDRRLLTALADAVSAGMIRPVISTVYPLGRIADAHRALHEPGRHGKVVLTTDTTDD